MVGRTRYALPLSDSLARKFDSLDRELDVRVLASRTRGSDGSDPRFRLVDPLPALDGPAFYALLPLRVARELRRERPDAVLVQGAQETALVLLGRALARSPAKVIADLHGDPAAPTRLYGSPLRAGAVAPAPTGSAASRCGAPTASGRSRPSRPSSSADRVSSPPPSSLPSWISTRSSSDRRRRCPSSRSRSSSACSSATRRSKSSPRPGGLAAARLPAARLQLVGRGTLR